MKNSRLFQLIRQLDRKEVQGLRKFLASPYFNQRKDVADLFELLWLIKGKSNLPDKQELFRHIYSDTPYHDGNFHLLKTYLLRLIEKYLATASLQDKPEEEAALLMHYYHQRGLTGLFKKTVKKLKQSLDQQHLRDGNYYEKQRDIVWEEYQLTVNRNPSGDLPLNDLTTWTDRAYFSQKLRQMCLLAAQQSIYRGASEQLHQAQHALLPYVEATGLLRLPAIALYYHGYHVLSGINALAHFQTFKTLLLLHYNAFEKQEARELFLIAINFCIKRVNAGEQHYFQEMFALYQDGLAKGLILDHGKLTTFSYHNIVASALQVKDYDWASEFIEQYKMHIDNPHRETAYHYNKARVAYEQGMFEEALSLIHNTHFTEVLPNLAAKAITLKIYFTLKEFDLLDAHLDAMINFIRRNQLIGYHKENYNNLARYTKRLVSLNPYDKSSVRNLREEILQEAVLTERKWLLEQL
ncbi:MAG: hypothetical protein HRU12_13410 [Phaeodactylibacter sp.]|nr:hypothetical protein [Phaeodactylibacter sp.]